MEHSFYASFLTHTSIEIDYTLLAIHCKLVGSLIDTTADITRRKGFSISAYNKLKKILERRRVSVKMKIKVISTYIKSIFLYNSEMWTMIKELEMTALWRRLLNIFWLEKDIK